MLLIWGLFFYTLDNFILRVCFLFSIAILIMQITLELKLHNSKPPINANEQIEFQLQRKLSILSLIEWITILIILLIELVLVEQQLFAMVGYIPFLAILIVFAKLRKYLILKDTVECEAFLEIFKLLLYLSITVVLITLSF